MYCRPEKGEMKIETKACMVVKLFFSLIEKVFAPSCIENIYIIWD